MEVSRSGYYKWLKTKDILNNYELNRNNMCDLVKDYHKNIHHGDIDILIGKLELILVGMSLITLFINVVNF